MGKDLVLSLHTIIYDVVSSIKANSFKCNYMLFFHFFSLASSPPYTFDNDSIHPPNYKFLVIFYGQVCTIVIFRSSVS